MSSKLSSLSNFTPLITNNVQYIYLCTVSHFGFKQPLVWRSIAWWPKWWLRRTLTKWARVIVLFEFNFMYFKAKIKNIFSFKECSTHAWSCSISKIDKNGGAKQIDWFPTEQTECLPMLFIVTLHSIKYIVLRMRCAMVLRASEISLIGHLLV